MVRVYLARIEGGEQLRGRSAHAFQSAAARRLLQWALERDCPELAGDFRVEKDDRGKPYLPGHENIHISLSHSGSLAACAVAGRAVGVDVEQRKERTASERVSRRFHEREQRWLERQPDEEQKKAFYDLWVRKESFLKAVGEGLRLPLRGFCTLGGEECPELYAGGPVRVLQDLRPETYFIRQYEVKGGEYSLAVCSEEAVFCGEPVTAELV